MKLRRVDSDTLVVLISTERTLNSRKRKKISLIARPIDRFVSKMNMNERAVEAQENVVIRLRRLGGGRTRLEFACEIELGFGASRSAVKHFVEHRLGEIAEISIYFQRLVPLKRYKVEDGVALAHDLLWMATSAKKRVERLKG